MKPLILAAALLSLMACSVQQEGGSAASPADPATAATPAAATDPAPAVPPAEAAAPSFDCAKAAGEVEKLVCADPELARLDRPLAERYAQARDRPDAVAMQRGWVKGRDDCWKADDRTRCVREAYQTRLVELAINGGGAVVPATVEYRCDDNSRPLTAVFYNDIDPPAAVISWGDDQAIAFPQPAASGARYGRQGLDFWEHQGEVKIDFYGNPLTCTPAR